jgi:hypothetical protein
MRAAGVAGQATGFQIRNMGLSVVAIEECDTVVGPLTVY